MAVFDQKPNNKPATESDAVATLAQNDRLKHSVEGVTTRDDGMDLGVPMLPGSPDEPVGPEDAAGGITRGDYSSRIGGSDYHPHTSELIENPEPDGPTTRLVPQRPIFDQTGEVEGVKGGVDPSTKRGA